MYGMFVPLLDTDLGNGTGHRTAILAAPLALVTRSLVRYEALVHSCGTSPMVVGRGVLTCDSTDSRRLYSAASLEYEAASTMIYSPIQLHYPDTERTSHCSILILLSTRLGSGKV